MTSIKAKYEGYCKRCRQTVNVGDPITKDDSLGYVHVECPEATGESPAPRGPLKARFKGYCKRCRQTVNVGDPITKDDSLGYVHAECPEATSESPAPRQPSAPRKRRTNRRPANCGRCGEPLAAGEGHLYRCGGEATGCMQHYDDEDGGWHVDCLDADECKARLQKRREQARAAAAIQKQFYEERQALVTEFFAGTYPDPADGQASLDGDEITMDDGRSRIYGGGEWYVIDSENARIWHVRNNGSDGDAWDRSNVRTGGAGAIGHYLPHSDELETRIRALSHAALTAALDEVES